MFDPFQNYKAEPAKLSLEQFVIDGKKVIAFEKSGKGKDIVHMLSMVFQSDKKDGGNLRKMVVHALLIAENTDEKMRIVRSQVK